MNNLETERQEIEVSVEDAERAVIASETASIKMILPAQNQSAATESAAIVITMKISSVKIM